MLKYNKQYSHIIQFYDNSMNLILKMPREDESNDYNLFEYYIYKLIDHPAFDSYDRILQYIDVEYDNKIIIYDYHIDIKLLLFTSRYNEKFKERKINILVGNYNSNMTNLHKFRHNNTDIQLLIKIYINILNILEESFTKWNFIHGDLKSNNILIDCKNPLDNIKLIDFEFSIIFNLDKMKLVDITLNNYLLLDDECIITKPFARLFDIYTLCLDLLSYTSMNLFDIKKELELVLEQKLTLSNNFIDFYIIFLNLYLISKSNFLLDNGLNISFISIIKNIKTINMIESSISYYSILNERMNIIKLVLQEMMTINLIYD